MQKLDVANTLMSHSREQRLAAVEGAEHARQARRSLFPSHLFADPAWDVLLVLYSASLRDQQCGLDALSTAGLAAKPLLCWLNALIGEGLVKASSTTGPATFRLTMSGLSKMECFFSSPVDTSHC